MFQSCIMRRLGKIGERSHAGAIGAKGHHAALGKQFHAVGVRIGIARLFPIKHVRNILTSLRKRAIELISIVTAKKNHIAKLEWSMLLLKPQHVFTFDQRALSLRGLIEQRQPQSTSVEKINKSWLILIALPLCSMKCLFKRA
jgi:hypothetical protein